MASTTQGIEAGYPSLYSVGGSHVARGGDGGVLRGVVGWGDGGVLRGVVGWGDGGVVRGIVRCSGGRGR